MADNEVIVEKLPFCDLHKAQGKFEVATYDARTKTSSPGRGSWGYLCETCFPIHGIALGVGFGQKLVLAKREDAKQPADHS